MTSDAGSGLAILVNGHGYTWKPLRVDDHPGISKDIELEGLSIFE